MEHESATPITVKFSKDNPTVEISSKQIQIQNSNAAPPVTFTLLLLI